MKPKYISASQFVGADLSQYHTKQLLNILHNARIQGQFDPETFSLIEELKTELATRPHILNRAEAKKLRQEKARAKKNR